MHESAGNTPILTTPEQLRAQNTLDHAISHMGGLADTPVLSIAGHRAELPWEGLTSREGRRADMVPLRACLTVCPGVAPGGPGPGLAFQSSLLAAYNLTKEKNLSRSNPQFTNSSAFFKTKPTLSPSPPCLGDCFHQSH